MPADRIYYRIIKHPSGGESHRTYVFYEGPASLRPYYDIHVQLEADESWSTKHRQVLDRVERELNISPDCVWVCLSGGQEHAVF